MLTPTGPERPASEDSRQHRKYRKFDPAHTSVELSITRLNSQRLAGMGRVLPCLDSTPPHADRPHAQTSPMGDKPHKSNVGSGRAQLQLLTLPVLVERTGGPDGQCFVQMRAQESRDGNHLGEKSGFLGVKNAESVGKLSRQDPFPENLRANNLFYVSPRSRRA